MKVTDGVMLDIKSWDENVYYNLVGASNNIVKENLKWLSDNNKIEELRIVVVPDYVDSKKCLEGIKETIGEKISLTKIKLITFRKNGVISKLSSHRSPTIEEMKELRDYALKLGYKNVIIK
jgi:pyruvate formate lyase activating enzyme